MKKIFLVMCLFLLTGCNNVDPVEPTDPVTCSPGQVLNSEGVCVDEEVVVPVDYEKELRDIYDIFMNDLWSKGIGSQNLQVVLTLNDDFLNEEEGVFVVSNYTEFDFNSFYIYAENGSTLTPDFDVYGTITKEDDGLFYAYSHVNGVETTNQITLNGTFEEDFKALYQVPFDLDLSVDDLDVKSGTFHVYSFTLSKDAFASSTGINLQTYLDDFTNPIVNVEMSYNQLDSEIVFDVSLVNMNASGVYKSMKITYTVKILDDLDLDDE